MSNEDDFYEIAGKYRYERLVADAAQVQADIANNKAQGNWIAASDDVQRLANIHAEIGNLEALHQQHVASKQPVYQRQLTSEERQSKPVEACDWGDTWEWANQSKHGVDPVEFQKGMAEVMRRRRAGE